MVILNIGWKVALKFLSIPACAGIEWSHLAWRLINPPSNKRWIGRPLYFNQSNVKVIDLFFPFNSEAASILGSELWHNENNLNEKSINYHLFPRQCTASHQLRHDKRGIGARHDRPDIGSCRDKPGIGGERTVAKTEPYLGLWSGTDIFGQCVRANWNRQRNCQRFSQQYSSNGTVGWAGFADNNDANHRYCA